MSVMAKKPQLEQDIRTAYYDNVRNNQIGGATDGISPEVAADLGYETADQAIEISQAVALAHKLGKEAVGSSQPETAPESTGRALARKATEDMRARHPASISTLDSMIRRQQERYRGGM